MLLLYPRHGWRLHLCRVSILKLSDGCSMLSDMMRMLAGVGGRRDEVANDDLVM